jgi:two-component system chemotaxis sensor kinase CheA
MALSGVDEGKLRKAFIEDAEELALKLNQSLLLLESEPDNRELVNEIFRLLHSLKSESAFLGFSVFSELAHRMEGVFGRVREGDLALEKAILDMVFAGSDLISDMLTAIARGGGDSGFETAAVVAGLSLYAASTELKPPAAADKSPEAAPAQEERPWSDGEKRQLFEARDRGEDLYRLVVSVDEGEVMKFPRAYLVFTNLELSANVIRTIPPMTDAVAEDALYARTVIYITARGEEDRITSAAEVDQISAVTLERLNYSDILSPSRIPAEERPDEKTGSAAGIPVPADRKGAPERTTIRVDTKKLDDLWSLIAELIQQKSHISRIHEQLSRGGEPGEVREELGESFDSLDKLSTNMQQVMMETRMIPISVIFNKLPRLVRDLSRKLGKSIDLAVSGEDTEIDRGIVEALSDPLTHIIRNSIDHGIESPAEREGLGKPEKGRVRVSAYQQGRGIVIELEDDGRGIDTEVLRKKAVEIGIEGATDMDEAGLLDLIFLPGFSTRAEVTDISGRGVGMDVVATKIKGDLKGSVTVNSVPGEGTLITLVLPLTLTIINALLVRSDRLVYAIPLTSVDSTGKVLNTEIRGDDGHRTCSWLEEEIPLFYIGAVQGKRLPRSDEYFAAILSYGMDRACLIVDELLEEQEVVVKPIDDLLNDQKRFSGISVLEDGTPVYILDTSFVQEGIL